MAGGYDVLKQTHQALCSPLVDERAFRAALGRPRSDLGSVAHYLGLPVEQRPDLSPYFDRLFYLVTNTDVAEAGLDPLLHFIEHGFAQRRSPHPLIDLRFIAGADAHMLGEPPAMAALLDLLEFDLASPSPYFDLDHYRTQLGDRSPARAALLHFLTIGIHEGVRPNPLFDPAWYAGFHGDAPIDAIGALRHFVVLGDRQGRAASTGFDGAAYRARNPDVAQSGMWPLAHYLHFGRKEGRKPVAAHAAAAARPLPHPVPNDVAAAPPWGGYEEMRTRLRTAHEARIASVQARAPKLVASKAPLADLARLRLPAAPAPRVSILVPMFNELKYTVECLMALMRARPSVSFEVVIADDASTDPDVRALAMVPNLRVMRQPANSGFIRNCNAAFLQCRAPYVLLLNNDTQVQPGAVDRLVAALDAMPGVAAAGAKLIYPNGRLQEAGCYLRADGESGMVGLGDDPDAGGFCYDRDVAYCSGAALIVRRALVGAQLFDTLYEPAYCEDADLCLRLIAGGYRVRYVHEAVVVHHLSVSTNRGSRLGKARGIIRNQHRLTQRWGPLLSRLDRVRTLAFYLPQFHPIPQNDLWWGKGFTEWTNVAKARPGYAGQHQPHLPADLGFYDLRSAETLTAQARLARRYGIEGFCVYSYHLGGGRVLSRPLEIVRADPSIPFRWCLCWANENWTRHWDGGKGDILAEQRYDARTLAAVIADAVSQAADPRYVRVRGCPVFAVYRPLLLPDPAGFAASCRQAFAAAGFEGVHLIYVESMETADRAVPPAELGFDAAVEFPPHGRAVHAEAPAQRVRDDWDGTRFSYPDTVAAFCHRPSAPYRRYPAVFPGWDNTPRQPSRGNSFDGATPEIFRAFVEERIEEARRHTMGDERLLFVNAWNEWAEGAHLEPDTVYGHRWLEALRDAVGSDGVGAAAA